MSLKIIDGTPSSISKFIREKEAEELRKQGAVEEQKKNSFVNEYNLKLIKAQNKRIKELEKRLLELRGREK